jgi:hypothetical protein
MRTRRANTNDGRANGFSTIGFNALSPVLARGRGLGEGAAPGRLTACGPARRLPLTPTLSPKRSLGERGNSAEAA